MRKILFSITLIFVAFPIFISAQDNSNLPNPGLTPDSPFYFFDNLGKKINLLFTFSSEGKAEKAIQYAGERIAEAKLMAEENKTEATDKANQGYQEFLNLANSKAQEAKEKGENIEELSTLITEKTLQHQEILVEVFEKVPEEARIAIEKAIMVSRKGSEEAVQTVGEAKKEELLQKIEEIKTRTEERITALEKKLEEKSAEAERLRKEMETVKEEAEKNKAEAEKLRKEAETVIPAIPAQPATPAIPPSGGGGATSATPAQPAQQAEPTQPATITPAVPAIPATPSSGNGGGGAAPATPAIPATPATPATTTEPTPPQDTTPPVISNIQVSNITENSATISWITNENGNSVVNYGYTTSSYEFSTSGTTVATGTNQYFHQVNLSNLTNGTIYHYKVISTDNSGNKAEGEDKIFTTITKTDWVVQDNFNTYTDGSIAGKDNWNSYTNGGNFIIQGNTVFEGAKALYNNSVGDSVIVKRGNSLSDGRQIFYIRTENRDNWATGTEAQIRITKGPWASGDPTWSFIAITFEKNGGVGYSVGGGVRKYFATYNDNEWIKLEIEWRSSDKKAKYRLNDGIWTDWDVFWNSTYFTNFDYVGFDFYKLSGGSGGVYFDNLY